MTKIIVVASEKGGVAKSTTTVHLAAALAQLGYRTLIGDTDPRGDCSSSLGMSSAPCIRSHFIENIPADQLICGASVVTDEGAVHRKNLDIFRGNQTTRKVATDIRDDIMSGDKEQDYIPNVWRKMADLGLYDYICLDTPPNGGFWPEQTYRSADLIVMPTSMDNIDMDAVRSTHAKVRKMQIASPVMVQPTICYPKRRLDRINLATIRETYGAENVLDPVPACAVMRESRAYGLTVFEYSPAHEVSDILIGIAETIHATLN